MPRTLLASLFVVLLSPQVLAGDAAPPEVARTLLRPDVDLGLAAEASSSIPIVVTTKGEVWFGGKRRDWLELDRELAKAGTGKTFRIVADRRLPWRAVRLALVAAAEAGTAMLEFGNAAGKTRLWRPTLQDPGFRGMVIVLRKEEGATVLYTGGGDKLGRLTPAGDEAALGEAMAEFVEFNDMTGVVVYAAGEPTYDEVARLAAICRGDETVEILLYAGPHPLEFATKLPTPPAEEAAADLSPLTRGPATVRPGAPEEVRSRIALPAVGSGRVAKLKKEEWIEIVLTKEREIWAGGRRHSGPDTLAKFLAPHAASRVRKPTPQERKGHGVFVELSDTPVVLRADRAALWADVVLVMEGCTHPDVRIHRLHWEVAGVDGEPVFQLVASSVQYSLDCDPVTGELRPRPGDPVRVHVEMARKRGGKRTTTLMDGKAVTLDFVRSRIRETGKTRRVLVELHVWESVPFGDVALLCAACDDAAGINFVDPRVRVD